MSTHDPWSPDCPDPLVGTVKAPRNWEKHGGWKLHYQVSQVADLSSRLEVWINHARREMGEERWAELQAEWKRS